MPRIEHSHSVTRKPVAADIEFEEVRQSFLIRLHSEQTRLGVLQTALRAAGSDPVSAFMNLESFAHRLRGAAAVFDFPGLRDDSKVLELAAADAVLRLSPVGEPHVQTAMRMLTTRLTRLNGGTSSADVAPALTPAN
jgi:hypothetical protein